MQNNNPKESTQQESIEERVARVEGALGIWDKDIVLPPKMAFAASIVVGISIVTAILGLGTPNHLYQIVLAALSVAVLYHREVLAKPKGLLLYLLAFLNSAVLAILFKLFIGSGVRHPFFFIKYPDIKVSKAEDSGVLDVIPEMGITWEPSSAALWSIDLTIVQSFLLIITIIGGAVEFQPFVSLTAFLLVFVSIPALVGFNWDLVFPSMIIAAVGFYLQLSSSQDNS